MKFINWILEHWVLNLFIIFFVMVAYLQISSEWSATHSIWHILLGFDAEEGNYFPWGAWMFCVGLWYTSVWAEMALDTFQRRKRFKKN